MNAHDGITLKGHLTVDVIDVSTGSVRRVVDTPNLITLAGRNLVRDRIAGVSANALTHLAVGTGTTAAAAGDTALETEVFRDAFTQTVESDGQGQFKLFIPSGSANGNTITEAGLLNAASNGTLFNRATFSGVVKDATKALQITWTITYADDGT